MLSDICIPPDQRCLRTVFVLSGAYSLALARVQERLAKKHTRDLLARGEDLGLSMEVPN